MSEYRQMWADLGLDLDKHDALLAVLGQAYQDVYLSQEGRPEAMGYFDFVMSEVHGLRIEELMDAKAQGRPVVGTFCVFVPEELILAVDGVCVGLCAGAEFGTEAAETYLPRNTCALIKSVFGFAAERVCPYLAAADVLVGEYTCDGKKKAYEELTALHPAVWTMDVPQVKDEWGTERYRRELRRFAGQLEELSGREITVESLRHGIEVVGAKRAALQRLSRLRQAVPSPVSGLDGLLINQISFYDDPARFTASVNTLCDELEARIAASEGVAPASAPRILLSGCPMAVPNWKVHHLLESAGAVVVGEESCVGDRGTQGTVVPEGDTVEELIDALVERYLTIDCAIFTPNPTRARHAQAMHREASAHGIIHYALQFCGPYQVEATGFERTLEAEGVPVLRIDTDYGSEDTEQLRTRMEAFVERIRP